MRDFKLLALLIMLSPCSLRAESFPVASPGQDAGKLMRRRKALLSELSRVGKVAEARPIKCGSSARIFAVLRKAEPPAACPKARDQYGRMQELEKVFSEACQGATARDLLRKFSADDDWYEKGIGLQADEKDSGELGKLECEIPLTLAFQARKRLERVVTSAHGGAK